MSDLVLGLGTAPMLGRVGRRESLAALESAYDVGIRYFDTARSYGWGDAEALVGGVLRRYPRDRYTLVSKCGLVPAKPSRMLSLSKQLARATIHRVPAAGPLVRRAASAPPFQPAATYDVSILRASLDGSLRALQTDYLDVLLLHHVVPGQPLQDVVEWFRSEKCAGRIRRYGFSAEGDLSESLQYLESQGALDDALVQAPVTDQLLTLPAKWRRVPLVAHSIFRYLAGRPRLTVGELFDALSSFETCEAVVASMFSRVHQVENLRALDAVRARRAPRLAHR
jgi:aryl-alcohol dehydrogenase-like predicted oxidoreductase